MHYQIIWSEPAVNQLRKLDHQLAKRIFHKVSELKEDPFRYVTKLVGSPNYRLRVGDYRVILEIQGSCLKILVLKIGHRRDIYK
ncbi:addiction module toxin RelE [Methanosarcina spelaei]|uniref:Addiction module toxin RelE n=1 Tax=Methanosarcina spelaei TaxID=1036679 RepID=A0A2A2HYE3_9EURY|nr:type II toxin-antitoxin system RelE/ParE family toxin [Methanosarcina spelaei]PAV14499.1 addiction module toxin RelE [Methanosarcina spelaei]